MKDLKKLVENLSGVFYNKKDSNFLILEPGNEYRIKEDVIPIDINTVDLSEVELFPYYNPENSKGNLLFVNRNIIGGVYVGNYNQNTNVIPEVCNIKNLIKVAELEEFNKIYENTVIKLVDEVNDIVLNKTAIPETKKTLIIGGNSPTISVYSTSHWIGSGQVLSYISLCSNYHIYITDCTWRGQPHCYNIRIFKDQPQRFSKSDRIYLLSEQDQERIFWKMRDFNNIFHIV